MRAGLRTRLARDGATRGVRAGQVCRIGDQFQWGPALNLIKSLVPELDAQAKAKAGHKRPTSFDELMRRTPWIVIREPSRASTRTSRSGLATRSMSDLRTDRYNSRVVPEFAKGANKRTLDTGTDIVEDYITPTPVERTPGFRSRSVFVQRGYSTDSGSTVERFGSDGLRPLIRAICGSLSSILKRSRF